MKAFENFGISPEDVNNVKIVDLDDILKIKSCLKSKFKKLMSGLLNLALRKNEEKLSWIITVEYDIILEEEILIRGISADNYQWLFYVWVTHKNFLGDRS